MVPHDPEDSSENLWPDLDSSYVDEFGPINATVYNTGRSIWPMVLPTINRTIRDPHAGQRVMMKAVALVSRKVNDDPERITNVHAYLYKAFIRLLREELEKEDKHAQLNLQMIEQSLARAEGPADQIYETILIHEILATADEQTRTTLENLILGYSFEEIAQRYGTRSNSLRSRVSKRLALIKAQIGRAERKILTRDKPDK